MRRWACQNPKAHPEPGTGARRLGHADQLGGLQHVVQIGTGERDNARGRRSAGPERWWAGQDCRLQCALAFVEEGGAEAGLVAEPSEHRALADPGGGGDGVEADPVDAETRDELREAISARAVTVVDALPESYYAQAHLPGALNLTEDAVGTRAAELLPDRGAAIVTYCSNLSCGNSQAVATMLERLGYQNVRKYREGIQDWVEAGLPTESGVSHAVAG